MNIATAGVQRKRESVNGRTAASCLAPYGFVKKSAPKKSEVFDTYWKFAAKRQEVFFARFFGKPGPWSEDPVLQEYKFTNAYRASDRVSQYLIKNVIYNQKWSLRDSIFRTLLFKLFNKIETWELLENQFGEICWDNFEIDAFDKVLEKAKSTGAAIYSAAYIIPSGSKKKYGSIRKHRFHLQLISQLIANNFHCRIGSATSMEIAFHELLKIDSLGKFLAYQFVTDLNYSEHFGYSENEFVVPGPGAKDGIRKCFSDLGDFIEEDIIKMMAEEQEFHFSRLGLEFKSLWGRPLQLIDCQNLFCEVDKYSRVVHPDIQGISGRTRIKQKLKPKPTKLDVWYPPKWGVNENIINDFLV